MYGLVEWENDSNYSVVSVKDIGESTKVVRPTPYRIRDKARGRRHKKIYSRKLATVSDSKENTSRTVFCEHCGVLQKHIRELEEKLDKANNKLQASRYVDIPVNNVEASRCVDIPVNTYTDAALPRPGKVNKKTAEKYKMIELCPGYGVYIYPADLVDVKKLLEKTNSGQSVARHLLSLMFTKEELCFGSVSKDPKPGLTSLDETVIKAIRDYCVAMSNGKKALINQALHNKLATYRFKARNRGTSPEY